MGRVGTGRATFRAREVGGTIWPDAARRPIGLPASVRRRTLDNAGRRPVSGRRTRGIPPLDGSRHEGVVGVGGIMDVATGGVNGEGDCGLGGGRLKRASFGGTLIAIPWVGGRSWRRSSYRIEETEAWGTADTAGSRLDSCASNTKSARRGTIARWRRSAPRVWMRRCGEWAWRI